MSKLQHEAHRLMMKLDEEMERYEESANPPPTKQYSKLRRLLEQAEKRVWRRQRIYA